MATRKLLLADDSVTIQKVVNLTFADEGMDVTSVGDGDRAVEKIEMMKPDIVLADVHMPGLNGYQVCEFVKRLPALSHIPVILLVGSFEPFDEEEARRVGADDYLTKPFQSIRQLVSRVNALLPEQQQQPVEVEEEPQPQTYEPQPEPVRPITDELMQPEPLSTGELMRPEPLSRLAEPITPPVRVAPPVHETWSPTPAQTFSDSVIDDELLEATSLGSDRTEEEQPTYSATPRETVRLSAEEVREFEIDVQPVVSTPQHVEVEYEPPPPSQDYLATAPVVEETQYAELEPEPVVENEPVAASYEEEKSPSPYTTTPLSEDTLLDFSYADTGVEDVEEDDSILDLGEDIYAPSIVIPVAQDVPPVNAKAADMFEAATVTETQNGEEIDMPASIETVSTSPVIETINVPSSISMNAGGTLSPEAIDAIARRVVEMLSDKTVREIAWEVVPELAELHIKRKIQEGKL